VVHGATAIAAAIERKVRVEATKSDRLAIDSRLRRPEELVPARKVVESLYKAKKAEPRVSISITSTLADGAGLGSSAATMIAIAGATSALEGWGLDQTALVRAGEAGEKLVHGNPSGVDATTSAMGGVILFKKGEEPRRVELRAPVTLLVVFSGRRRNTGRLIGRVAGMKETYPSLFASLCESATLVSGLCAEALVKGDTAALGRLMTYSHAVLARAGNHQWQANGGVAQLNHQRPAAQPTRLGRQRAGQLPVQIDGHGVPPAPRQRGATHVGRGERDGERGLAGPRPPA